MPLRLSNIRLKVGEPEDVLRDRLAAALGVRSGDIARWRILRKSLDTRDKRDVSFVYSAEVEMPLGEEQFVIRARRGGGSTAVEPFVEEPFEVPPRGERGLTHRPIVVGAGPAGLVAAWFLASQGYAPLVLERGRAVKDRIRDVKALDAGGAHDPESNYLFGEGGAGTFSDGKLTCRSTGADVRRVLELLAECKGKPSVVFEHRPHLGSNRLPAVVKALRRRIEAAGGEFRFECRVEDLDLDGTSVRGLATSSGHIAAEVVILAIGHSARDTYEMLARRQVPMEQKAFQLGVRIEQPQAEINRAQYGDNHLEAILGAADYSVVARGPRDLFSFCMCAGGQVIPSVSEAGHFATNGMSLSRRDSPFANSGLMVTIQTSEFPSRDILAGVALQREFERRAFEIGLGDYRCPIQRAADFLAGRASRGAIASSYVRKTIAARLEEVVPVEVARSLRASLPMLDRRWHGRFLREATLVGPESRGSSPVRISRDPSTFESVGVAGLYPVGEGAGFAGGIVSAAVDGLRAAKSVVSRFAPFHVR